MKPIAIASCLFAVCLFATSVMAQSPSAQATAQATATAPPKVSPIPQAAVIYQTAPAPAVTYQVTPAPAAVTAQANSAQAAVLVLPGPALPQPAPCAGNCPQLSLLATNANATAFATATATMFSGNGNGTALACWHPFRKLKAILKIRR